MSKNHLPKSHLKTNTLSQQIFEIQKEAQELETKETLAKRLKFSVSYINKLMKQKKIPWLKIGRTVRFIFSEVIAALQNGSTA